MLFRSFFIRPIYFFFPPFSSFILNIFIAFVHLRLFLALHRGWYYFLCICVCVCVVSVKLARSFTPISRVLFFFFFLCEVGLLLPQNSLIFVFSTLSFPSVRFFFFFFF